MNVHPPGNVRAAFCCRNMATQEKALDAHESGVLRRQSINRSTGLRSAITRIANPENVEFRLRITVPH